jgi:mono/diheme cytochrome c family protein
VSLPWQREVVLAFALEIAVVAAILLLAGWWMRRRGRLAFATRLFASTGIATAVAAISAVAAFTIAPTLPTPAVPFTAQFRTNPVPNSPENVTAGRTLFQQNCVICHGARGRGDGPAAFTMNPKPVDLQLHVPQHPDGFIEYWIAEGIPGTQMPAWKDQLNEEQRWQLVRYLRELAAGRP